MTTKTFARLAACAALALAAPVFAAPATAAAPAAKAKGPATTAPTTAAGIACTAQADAQNLHGKARQAFRAKCKDGMKTPVAKPGATKPVATPAPKATSAPK